MLANGFDLIAVAPLSTKDGQSRYRYADSFVVYP